MSKENNEFPMVQLTAEDWQKVLAILSHRASDLYMLWRGEQNDTKLEQEMDGVDKIYNLISEQLEDNKKGE